MLDSIILAHFFLSSNDMKCPFFLFAVRLVACDIHGKIKMFLFFYNCIVIDLSKKITLNVAFVVLDLFPTVYNFLIIHLI